MQHTLLVLVMGLVGCVVQGTVAADEQRIHSAGYCAMYDNGDPSTYHPGAGSYVKFSNEPAHKMNPEFKKSMKAICPKVAATGYSCCSPIQLGALVTQTILPKSMLNKCEVSWDDFISLLCEFTCGPDQSLIVNATKLEPTLDGKSQNVVEIDVFLEEEYKTKYYNSMKDVSLPAANMKAIVALCGSSRCDKDLLFKFMGDNSQSPFPINFVTSLDPVKVAHDNGTMQALNDTELLYCWEKPDNDSWVCSCEDCDSNYTCGPTPVEPSPANPFLIFGYDGVLIIMLIIYIALFLVCLVHLAINLHYKRRNETDPMTRSASIASSFSERHIEAMQSQVNKGCRKVDDILHTLITTWARFAITHIPHVIIAATLIVGALCAGMYFFVMTSAPIDLWSSPTSQTRLEKEKFDSTFVPFYRTTQIIITAPRTPSFNYTIYSSSSSANGTTQTFSGMFSKEIFMKVLHLQQGIVSIVAKDGNRTIGVKDVCFIPLDPDVKECALISPYQWFQNSEEIVNKITDDNNTYLNHIFTCVNSPLNIGDGDFDDVSCLSAFNGPATVNVALGGFQGSNYIEAQAIVITIPLNNHVNETLNKDAELWEKEFIGYMKGFNDSDLEIAFQAERSIQDELDREAFQDVYTVALSYFLMFGYVALMLGKVSCCADQQAPLYCIRRWFIDAKISLGLAGVLFVLLSVICSLGIFSYAGFKSTVIVMEVIPFLVLAVGVDNIFILVQALQRDIKSPAESTDDQIVRIFGSVGPSMLLSATSEVIAFACGSLSSQPAVHDFSLYASVAVLINFLLQISVFLVLLAVDRKREQGERLDVLCCFTGSTDIHVPDGMQRPRSPLYLLVSKVWVPALLNTTIVRFLVMSFFGLTFCLSIAAIPHLEVGLDQQLALPKDSYMGPYFDYISKYLEVGAPVYFVVEHDNLNVSTYAGQNELCGVSGCNIDSLLTTVNQYAKVPHYSRLGQPPNSWIDDYFTWLEPAGDESCCQVWLSGEQKGEFCRPSDYGDCASCVAMGEYPHHRPNAHQFEQYFDWYLSDNPTTDGCTKGGHAAYGNAVKYNSSRKSATDTNVHTNITASYFMAYHTTCRNSSDFIAAYKEARNLSNYIGENINSTVYPYSVFYVYYEMYVDMVNQVAINLSVCIAAVFLVSFVLLNFNYMAAIITTSTVLMITVNMLGMMYVLDINVNPVSLVNLVMSVGISVEFCSHITRSFAQSRQPHRVDRAKEALAKTGSSVLSGIFMTKIIGISVLAFAKSQIFEIYYFKMYVCIVALGMLHGLVFLPVFLTFFGPSRNTQPLPTTGFGKIDDDIGVPDERQPLLK